MCSGSEAGSYLKLVDFVHHSTLGLRVIKKKKRSCIGGVSGCEIQVSSSGIMHLIFGVLVVRIQVAVWW